MEIFKEIEKHPDYFIGTKGTVKSLKYGKERVLKSQISKKGYARVGLHSGKFIIISIHKLMAVAFLNHKPNKMNEVVDHIDGNSLNNNIENLQIITNRLNVSKDKSNVSGLTGVTWSISSKKWRAQIFTNGLNFNLGVWECKKRAKIAYDFALFQLNKFERYA